LLFLHFSWLPVFSSLRQAYGWLVYTRLAQACQAVFGG
jgi:hypothetical protein